MITIITGKINSGKTTYIKNLYQKDKKGDGVISIKEMIDNTVDNYQSLHLKSNQIFSQVLRNTHTLNEDEIICQIGPYNFLESGLVQSSKLFHQMIDNFISPIYIDEIGLLELDDKHYHNIFKELIKSGLDIVFTVRTDLLDQIIKKYNIKEPKIIRI
ncbi:hypothetical protein CI105_05810 [Candidatus Izimaplasma bacterium ZiA1]|uniref:nucleoside-triphosphatase n=1 Tax=Candidatus Izimoplasma sp. ZiA1 TaxID=2024899 RepID=UPI000BAA7DAD|nr:hypothetical protein CI105_05810 [Candidatus Izimaplasma bacterium ZiA1]